MREDQAVAANPRVIADHHRLGRIDERELQNDGAAAKLKARLGKLRAADVHLLANLRVLADPDRLAGDVAHRPDAGVASDRDVAALHDGEQTDLDMIAEVHRFPHDDAAETETHAFADAIAEQPAVGETLERTG